MFRIRKSDLTFFSTFHTEPATISVLGAFLVLACLVGTNSVSAQFQLQNPAQPGGAVPRAPGPGNGIGARKPQEEVETARRKFDILVPPDRNRLRLLEQIEQLIETQRNAEAIRLIGDLLSDPGDSFLPPEDASVETIRKTLRHEVVRLLGRLSPEGRQLYELQYGPAARLALQEAIATGDPHRLAEVISRYYGTEASFDASFLLGLYQFDQGISAAAAMTLGDLQEHAPEPGDYQPLLGMMLATSQLHAGRRDEAKTTLDRLLMHFPELSVTSGAGEELSLASPEASLRQLLQWSDLPALTPWEVRAGWFLFRAVPWRNVSTEASAPLLRLAWRIPTVSYPKLDPFLERLMAESELSPHPMLPGCHPIVVDRIAFLRTIDGLLAVDLETGKRLWKKSETGVGEVLGGSRGFTDMMGRPGLLMENNPMLWLACIRLRLWGDLTYGTLSSDGDRIFSIEEIPLIPGVLTAPMQPMGLRPGAGNADRKKVIANALAARDPRTGRLLWKVGRHSEEDVPGDGARESNSSVPAAAPFEQWFPDSGSGPNAPDEEESGEEKNEESMDEKEDAQAQPLEENGNTDREAELLQETYFLGPPLPLEGRLYVLGEVQGMVHLFVLASETGELLHRLPLVEPAWPIERGSPRRFSGITPSAHGGILVCPTSAGAVVAIDRTTLELRWCFLYDDEMFGFQERRGAGRFISISWLTHGSDHFLQNRWHDSAVLMVDGKVLATPVGSEQLFCLDLETGEVLWEHSRGNDLFVAGVCRGHVVVVGVQQIRAYRLDDGAPAWKGKTIRLPEGTSPAGTGIISGTRYYQPLADGGIAECDLTGGTLVRTMRARDADVGGNLIAASGRILAQRAGAVDAFHQIEALRERVNQTLAKEPEDIRALLAAGHIDLSEGRLAEAIDHFREAEKVEPTGRVRSALLDALEEGLDTSFDTYKDEYESMLKLAETDRQRRELLRSFIAGYLEKEQWRSAWDKMVALLQLQEDDSSETGDQTLVRDGSNRQLPESRWISGTLAALDRSSGKSLGETIDRWVSERLETVLESKSLDAMERFLDRYGELTDSASAWNAFFEQCGRKGQLARQELLLRKLPYLPSEKGTSDDARTAEWMADLAHRLQNHAHWRAAWHYYQLLGEKFAKLECRGDKTGADLMQEASALPEIARVVREQDAWPIGDVEIRRSHPEPEEGETEEDLRNRLIYRRYIDTVDTRGPFLKNLEFAYFQSPEEKLTAYHDYGGEAWTVPIEKEEKERLSRGSGMGMMGGMDPLFGSTNGYGSKVEEQLLMMDHLVFYFQQHQLFAVDALTRDDENRAKLLWQRSLEGARPQTGKRGGTFALNSLRNMFTDRPEESLASLPGGIGRDEGVCLTPLAICYRVMDKIVALDPYTGRERWNRDGLAMGAGLTSSGRHVIVMEPKAKRALVLDAADGRELGRCPLPSHRFASLGPLVISVEGSEKGFAIVGTDLLAEEPEQRRAWSIDALAPNTMVRLVDEDRKMVLMDPKGRFRLIDLRFGRIIIDSWFPSPKGQKLYTDVEVFPFRDSYIVMATEHRQITQTTTRRRYQVQGMASSPVGRAVLNAFKDDGTEAWKQPLWVNNTHFFIHQPKGLPVLFFGATIDERSDEDQGRSRRNYLSIFGIDKRTGKGAFGLEVRHRAQPFAQRNTMRGFRIRGVPEENLICLDFSASTIKLHFTGKEKDEKEASSDEDESASEKQPIRFGKVLQALEGAIQATPIEIRQKSIEEILKKQIAEAKAKKEENGPEEEMPPEE